MLEGLFCFVGRVVLVGGKKKSVYFCIFSSIHVGDEVKTQKATCVKKEKGWRGWFTLLGDCDDCCGHCFVG